MSLRHLLWARTLPANAFSPATRAVLRSLAEHADNQGRAWPSRRTIARECSLHPRTVQRALGTLREGGWIAPAGARGSVPVWQLASPGGLDASPTPGNTPPPWESQEKDKESHPPVGGRVQAPAGGEAHPPTQSESAGAGSEPGDLEAPPGPPGWWHGVSRLATAIEEAPLGSPVAEPGGRRRRMALLRFAEWWSGRPFCRQREQPVEEIERLLAGCWRAHRPRPWCYSTACADGPTAPTPPPIAPGPPRGWSNCCATR